MHEIVLDPDGYINAQHGLGRMKMERLPDPKDNLAIKLMRTIKMGFDPGRLLNPRRLFSPDRRLEVRRVQMAHAIRKE